VADAERILVANGKKTMDFKPSAANKAEIMAKILGRTGNLRAPALRRGKTYYIGFNDDLYQQLTGA
jgi:hypothetical protein